MSYLNFYEKQIDVNLIPKFTLFTGTKVPSNILISFLILVFLVSSLNANSQNTVTPAPAGFDIIRSGIPHGKIDTITYNSKTVGNKRKALIYTPPGYSKDKKYPFTYYMALVVTKRNGLTVVNRR